VSRTRTKHALLAAVAALLAAALAALWPSTAQAEPMPVTGDIGIHDPSMVATAEGYALYGSNNLLDARTSPDRAAWSNAGSAFAGPQDWWSAYSPEQSPWAPDVHLANGTYYMYYAVSSFGSNTSAIGLATSDTGLPGSFTDHGEVYSTNADSDHNAIDPNLFIDDDGTWWMAFGSWWTGIKMFQLDPSTGMRAEGSELYSLASAEGGIEGPALVKNGDYYYLFSSYGVCCQGTDSTYSIRVGRSESPTGPFTDANGVDLLDGGGTTVLASDGRYIGPGGQSVLGDADGDVLVFHYYDGEDNGAPKLGLNLIDWSSGWPVVS
jgi:arabinan endo-1,5-alpha-L-arabinosidase